MEYKKRSNVALVVPTIRKDRLIDFVERWKKIGLFDVVDLIIVEDNPTRSFPFPNDVNCVHVAWKDIAIALDENQWIIPRRSDTIRSYGYFLAWHMEYDFIMTLDDDCYPATKEDGLQYDGRTFVEEHLRWLMGRSRWQSTLNTARPRGIPYRNLGKTTNIVLNHGLWTNVLDYDSLNQLASPVKEKFLFDNRIVPQGFYFPMSGMNLMWKREATVLLYHLMMGHRMVTFDEQAGMADDKLEKLPYDRMGDIWAGIFLKKICDFNGLLVSTGMPYVRHERASDPFINLQKETNGIVTNEKLWEHVDKFVPGYRDMETHSLVADYEFLGDHVAKYDGSPEYKGYFEELGKAMRVWASLFKEGE